MTEIIETTVRTRVLGNFRNTWISFVHIDDSPEVRVRFKGKPTHKARYRCDECGGDSVPSCPHAAAAVAAIRLQMEAQP